MSINVRKQDIMIYKGRLQSVLDKIHEKEKLILDLLLSYDIKNIKRNFDNKLIGFSVSEVIIVITIKKVEGSLYV